MKFLYRYFLSLFLLSTATILGILYLLANPYQTYMSMSGEVVLLSFGLAAFLLLAIQADSNVLFHGAVHWLDMGVFYILVGLWIGLIFLTSASVFQGKIDRFDEIVTKAKTMIPDTIFSESESGKKQTEGSPESGMEKWMPKAFKYLKFAADCFVSFYNFVVTIAKTFLGLFFLAFFCIMAIFPLLLLCLCWKINFKPGILGIPITLLLLVSLATWFSSNDFSLYLTSSLFLGWVGLFFSVSWSTLAFRGTLSYHPDLCDVIGKIYRESEFSDIAEDRLLGEIARRAEDNDFKVSMEELQEKKVTERLVGPGKPFLVDKDGLLRPARKRALTMGLLALGAISIFYLVYPSMGIFELLPDSIPVLGNVDEALFLYFLAAWVIPAVKNDWPNSSKQEAGHSSNRDGK